MANVASMLINWGREREPGVCVPFASKWELGSAILSPFSQRSQSRPVAHIMTTVSYDLGHAARIELQRMPHELHLRNAGEDWTGITD